MRPDKIGRYWRISEIVSELATDTGGLPAFHAALRDHPTQTFCMMADLLVQGGYRDWIGEYFNFYWQFLDERCRRDVAQAFCERAVQNVAA